MVITSKPLGGCGYKVFERQYLGITFTFKSENNINKYLCIVYKNGRIPEHC